MASATASAASVPPPAADLQEQSVWSFLEPAAAAAAQAAVADNDAVLAAAQAQDARRAANPLAESFSSGQPRCEEEFLVRVAAKEPELANTAVEESSSSAVVAAEVVQLAQATPLRPADVDLQVAVVGKAVGGGATAAATAAAASKVQCVECEEEFDEQDCRRRGKRWGCVPCCNALKRAYAGAQTPAEKAQLREWRSQPRVWRLKLQQWKMQHHVGQHQKKAIQKSIQQITAWSGSKKGRGYELYDKVDWLVYATGQRRMSESDAEAEWTRMINDDDVYKEQDEVSGEQLCAVRGRKYFRHEGGSSIGKQLTRENSDVDPKNASAAIQDMMRITDMRPTNKVFRSAAGRVFAGGAKDDDGDHDAEPADSLEREFAGLIQSDGRALATLPAEARPELERQLAVTKRLDQASRVHAVLKQIGKSKSYLERLSSQAGYKGLSEDGKRELGLDEQLASVVALKARGDGIYELLVAARSGDAAEDSQSRLEDALHDADGFLETAAAMDKATTAVGENLPRVVKQEKKRKHDATAGPLAQLARTKASERAEIARQGAPVVAPPSMKALTKRYLDVMSHPACGVLFDKEDLAEISLETRVPAVVLRESLLAKCLDVYLSGYGDSMAKVLNAVHNLRSDQPVAGASAPVMYADKAATTEALREVLRYMPKVNEVSWQEHAAPKRAREKHDFYLPPWQALEAARPWVGAIFAQQLYCGVGHMPLGGLGAMLFMMNDAPVYVCCLSRRLFARGKGVKEWLQENDGRSAATGVRKGYVFDVNTQGPQWLWIPPGFWPLMVHAGQPTQQANFVYLPWLSAALVAHCAGQEDEPQARPLGAACASEALEALGTVVQNTPFCQLQPIHEGFLARLSLPLAEAADRVACEARSPLAAG